MRVRKVGVRDHARAGVQGMHVPRNSADSESGRGGGVAKYTVDNRAALLSSGAEDGDDLLGHVKCEKEGAE